MKLNDRVVWIDVRASGLDPAADRLERLSVAVTDKELAVLAEAEDVSVDDPKEAEQVALALIAEHVEQGVGILAGTRVQDVRRVLAAHLPVLFGYLHYRSIDVSTVRELVRRWYPDVHASRPPDAGSIQDGIAERRHYRETAFAPAPASVD